MVQTLRIATPFISFGLLYSTSIFAMEDANVLPKGVRRAQLNSMHQNFDTQTNANGSHQSMATKLQRDIRFTDFIKQRSGIQRRELEGFLAAQNIDPDTSIGSITADLKARVDVFAPSFSYGISDKWSIGVIVPIIVAKTDVDVGFTPSEEADAFVAELLRPEISLRTKAAEAVNAVNTVVDRLETKLADQGYKSLDSWEDSGVGDIQVKAKYQALKTSSLRVVSTLGAAVPTGRTDDPDHLSDIAFGDGTWDVITMLSLDQPVGGPFFINEYLGYVAQLPARRTVRMRTEEESIEVEKKEVTYNLGDKVDAGASLQWDASSGLIGGTGYGFQYKSKDDYQAGASSSVLEDGTEQMAHHWESTIGYSSVRSYFAKTSRVPYAASAGYVRQLASRNLPVAHRFQLEMKVFF
jgi:hypothetical protein